MVLPKGIIHKYLQDISLYKLYINTCTNCDFQFINAFRPLTCLADNPLLFLALSDDFSFSALFFWIKCEDNVRDSLWNFNGMTPSWPPYLFFTTCK